MLKGYVQNRTQPKGCIVECYIAEEGIEFCTKYLSNVDAIGIPSRLTKNSGHQYLEVIL